ncbi:MAG: T9SS type A sorting domain-containing protein [Bacteroidales bacterium]|nr:T9SS type A sorting domain-containing protein [Bacteroidales bacterium]
MKKITLFILALGLTMGAMAQKANVSSTTLTSNLEVRQAEMKFGVKTDAAKTPSIYKPSAFSSCGSTDTPKIYTTITDGGDTLYVTGSNGSFFGFAQHFPVTATVTGVAAVLVKAFNGDDIATDVLLTNADFSQTLATTTYQPATIDGSAFAVYQYTFSAPVANASNFNVAIKIPEYTQTSTDILLATTAVGCSSGLTRYIYYQNAWADITTMFTTFDADFMLFPIVEGNVNGLNNVDVNSLTYVYPNPAKDQVMLASSFNMDKVEIFNIMGQKVYENSVNGISTTVNVADFTPGTYVVKMFTEAGLATKKIVVE